MRELIDRCGGLIVTDLVVSYQNLAIRCVFSREILSMNGACCLDGHHSCLPRPEEEGNFSSSWDHWQDGIFIDRNREEEVEEQQIVSMLCVYVNGGEFGR